MPATRFASSCAALGIALVLAGPVLGAEPVHGKVTDSSGKPVAGAEVVAIQLGTVAKTGEDGTFAFPLPVPREALLVTVRKPGFRDGRGWACGCPEGEGPQPIVLEPLYRCAGRVLAADGSPVAGVKVTAEHNAGDVTLFSATATSGEDGRFAYECTAEPHDISAVRGAFQDTGLGREPEIRLPESAILALDGRVTDRQGRPVPDAGVEVSGGSYGLTHLARTGAEGRYRLAGLEPGEHRVAVTVGRSVEERTVQLSPREARLDLAVPRATIHGRVLSPAGEPVPQATVTLLGNRGEERTTSAADGSFAIVGLDGWFQLAAEKPGMGAARLARFLRVEREASGVEIRLPRVARLSGEVRGLSAEQLARAWATATHETLGLTARAMLGPDGRFQWNDLTPGRWKVAVTGGPRRLEIEVELAPGGAAAVQLAPSRLFRLSGHAWGGDGLPLGRQLVVVRPRGSREIACSAWTDREGAFTVEVVPGEYEIAAGSGLGREIPFDRPVAVVDGDVPGLAVRLPLPGRIAGHLSGCPAGPPTGIEAKSAFVSTPVGGTVREDGSYEIGPLGPGDWKVRAVCDTAVAVGRITVPAGGTAALDLAASPGLTVDGSLAHADRLARYEVHLAPLGDDRAGDWQNADAKGRFTFRGLLPGRYRLEVLNTAGIGQESVYSKEIELAADRTVAVELADR